MLARRTIAESFDEHYAVDATTGCHVWQRSCKADVSNIVRRKYWKHV